MNRPPPAPGRLRGLGAPRGAAAAALGAPELAAEAAELAVTFLKQTEGNAANAAVDELCCEVEDGCIIIKPHMAEPLRVPLPHAELAHAAAGPARYVLALVPPVSSIGNLEEAELGVWLFTLRVEKAALLPALGSLSRLGVVRACIDEAFSLSRIALGTGGYGSVYLGATRGSGVPAAIKLAKAGCAKANRSLLVEMRTLLAVQGHANVVCYMGMFRATPVSGEGGVQWALAQQLCERGDLAQHIASNGPLGEVEAIELLAGTLAAIAHVHKCGIVHRDVKAANILLTKEGTAVLADFGAAAFLADSTSMAVRCGTLYSTAPEVLMAPHKYGSKVDVFAFGVTLFYALFGQLPFQGRNRGEVRHNVIFCEMGAYWGDVLERLAPPTRAVLLWTLAKCPEQRPSAESALAHACFRHRSSVAAEASEPWSEGSSTLVAYSDMIAKPAAPGRRGARSTTATRLLRGLRLVAQRLGLSTSQHGPDAVAVTRCREADYEWPTSGTGVPTDEEEEGTAGEESLDALLAGCPQLSERAGAGAAGRDPREFWALVPGAVVSAGGERAAWRGGGWGAGAA